MERPLKLVQMFFENAFTCAVHCGQLRHNAYIMIEFCEVYVLVEDGKKKMKFRKLFLVNGDLVKPGERI